VGLLVEVADVRVGGDRLRPLGQPSEAHPGDEQPDRRSRRLHPQRPAPEGLEQALECHLLERHDRQADRHTRGRRQDEDLVRSATDRPGLGLPVGRREEALGEHERAP
jgi:hypothetical protein